MNQKQTKHYFEMDIASSKTSNYVKMILIEPFTPLEVAEVVVPILRQNICIYEDTVYIDDEETSIKGYDIHKYIRIMSRKAFEHAIQVYRNGKVLTPEVIQACSLKYYDDILYDIEYMLLWDDDEDKEDEEYIIDEDDMKDDIKEDVEEDIEEEDEEAIEMVIQFHKKKKPQHEKHTVSTIKGIVDFI